MTATIQKQEIARLIPHAGSMCLNEQVLNWNKTDLLCTTQTHLANNNPLLKNNKLSALHAIEYCAQAMAIHGGLLAREQGETLAPGYLAAVRDVSLSFAYLDDIKNTLHISVKQLMAQSGNLMYEFRMYFLQDKNEVSVATGRATVIQMDKGE